MTKNLIPMTAQTPSGFAMPTSAPTTAAHQGTRVAAATGMSAVEVCTAPAYVVRDRVAGDALITGAFPGHTAWSPPTC